MSESPLSALLPEPLAVWDAADPDWPRGPYAERADWVRRHCGDPRFIHCVEFCLLDTPFAVVHAYARNGDERKYQDPKTGLIAAEPPVIVPLTELPPAHLIRPRAG